MEAFYRLIGEGSGCLTWFQMGLRALMLFVIALIFLRISGRRSFGLRSPFDNVISILLGAVLSRAVTGASPFFPTIIAALVIASLHRIFAWISLHSHAFGKLIKGSPKQIVKDGKIIRKNMDRCLVTDRDLEESIRLEAGVDSLDDIASAYVERGGTISLIKKKTGGNYDPQSTITNS
jgi:uncharacterized membrane protein YcaP (DUF421 family)